MGTVGRFLGMVLGPRGKMPRPVPPTLDPAMVAAGLKDTAIVRSRDNLTFHSPMGSREQSLDDLTNNAMAIWTRVTGKLRGVVLEIFALATSRPQWVLRLRSKMIE